MENQIAIAMMRTETVPLETGNLACEMCAWLETGFLTAEGLAAIEAYATEILLHRRLMHVSQGCPN